MSRVALVVDDNTAVLEIVAGMLEDLGCEVICAPNALAAVETNQRIEILISDINIPGLSGYQLAEEAKRLRGRGINVILLSGREADSHGFPMIRKRFYKAICVA